MQEIMVGAVHLGEHPLIAVPLTDKALSINIEPVGADILEIRVDMFSDLSYDYVSSRIQKAKEKFHKPLITTIRRSEEGGAAAIPEKDRLDLFKAVMDYTDAVDIEINSEIFGSVIKQAHKKKKTIIGSFHDFHKTPGIDELIRIVEKGRSFKADIVKIAVMPHHPDDLRNLTALTLKYYDQGIITIGMGALGMTSRIFLPLIGSLITFASLETETAPGQLSLDEMNRFFSAAGESELHL